MNSVKRRGGKPNRGGGRGRQNNQRGRGSNAAPQPPPSALSSRGGNSRKGYDNFCDDDLYFPEDTYDDEPDDSYGIQDRSETAYSDAQSAPSKLKIDMQILHMSEESQNLAKTTLRELRGSSYQIKESKVYKDTGRRLDRRFWVQDRQLLVRGGTDYSDANNRPSPSKSNSEKVNKFALKKLENFGFHSSRCISALRSNDGDFGKSLEQLMSSCFDLNLEKTEVGSENVLEYNEQKDDEKMALESIYVGKEFNEKITNKLWELKLKLPYLLKYLPKEDEKAKPKKDPRLSDNKICKFHLNGNCRFGSRCHKKHVETSVVDDRHLREPEEDESFFLEIRFPEDLVYPRDPPIVSFYTEMKKFPKGICLKITARLMEEAKSLAAHSQPSVFALVAVLENEADIKEVIKSPDNPFSFSEDLAPKKVTAAEELNGAEGLLTSLSIQEKETLKREVTRDKAHLLLNDNDRIRKRYRLNNDDRKNSSKMMEQRRSLPAWNEQSRILSALKNSQVVVISGMTGCGKSTQVPQFIIDEWLLNSDRNQSCYIICTQPRRLSAIGVAERVSSERNERVGNLVGYQIRLESKISNYTRLLFCTTGILLRRLESDSDLESVTHVIVDEVHERSEESDFLLMILRDLLLRRKDLKVILMSATLNANLFANYFGSLKPPIIEIPGRTFPVKQLFLGEIIERTHYNLEEGSTYARISFKRTNFDDIDDEYELDLATSSNQCQKPPKDKQKDEELDPSQINYRYGDYVSSFACKTLATMDFNKIDYDLIERTLVYIADEDHEFPRTGSILVFLPGMAEIMNLYDQLYSNSIFSPRVGRFKLIPLHSSLSSEEQSAIFAKPKDGVRKVVISTNLAETSITIDDCVFVVEVGRMKEKRFDPMKNMESLDTVWVSKANALQRKGRAGRVMPGVCFHLYTDFRYEYHFRKDPIPEIQRVPLERMILRIKILPLFENLDAKTVMSNMIEPPHRDSVTSAMERLQAVSALDENFALTPLGYHLASLPVDVRIGKLMLYGAIFRCLDSALTIAACLSYRSPFLSPFGKREEANRKKLEFAGGRKSDQLTVMKAYNKWREICQETNFRAGANFANENFLSVKTLQMLVSMKHQFAELLASIGFVSSDVTTRMLNSAARTKGGSDAIISVTGEDINENCKNDRVIVAVLCAALYPNVVQILSPELRYKKTAGGAMHKPHAAEDMKFKTKEDGYVNIHPSSVNYKESSYESSYMVYNEKIKTSRVFVRELTMVPIYPMILFGRAGLKVELERGQFVLTMENGWIKFITASHQIAELLKEMRFELDELLAEKIENPSMDLLVHPRGKMIISTIVSLISKE